MCHTSTCYFVAVKKNILERWPELIGLHLSIQTELSQDMCILPPTARDGSLYWEMSTSVSNHSNVQ